MKLRVIAVTFATGALLSAPVVAQEDLAKSNGCLNCHAADTKKVGPSFKEVAAKYKGKADAEATLVAKLKEGKGHPATKGSEADTKSLVKWVLSM
ncbi:MAG TPA: c-type cytochrome [Casimicrobiaceae bacterium]|jgi:cytochrome c